MKRIGHCVAAVGALVSFSTAQAQPPEYVLSPPASAERFPAGGMPSLSWSGWMQDISARLVPLIAARPVLTTWRSDVAALQTLAAPAPPPVLLDRTRIALVAQWQPWRAGHWHFGAALGLRGNADATRTARSDFEWMPMFSFEQTHYRVNLGLLAPQADRSAALLLGMSIPLR
jgi:hypothetical protein